MADRLINSIAADAGFNGHLLDIGGGSGLVTQRLLERYPQAKVTLIDPAEQMCALAKNRFGDRIRVETLAGDQVDGWGLSADGALCSAAFHLMDEQTTLPSIAAVLKQGSVFAFNLWGHSFDETASLDRRVDWSVFVDQALSEYQEAALPPVKSAKRRPRNLKTLSEIGEKCRLQFQKKEIVEVQLDAKFHIEFAAMTPSWLGDIGAEKREQIIGRALELASGTSTIFYVDFSFVKM